MKTRVHNRANAFQALLARPSTILMFSHPVLPAADQLPAVLIMITAVSPPRPVSIVHLIHLTLPSIHFPDTASCPVRGNSHILPGA